MFREVAVPAHTLADANLEAAFRTPGEREVPNEGAIRPVLGPILVVALDAVINDGDRAKRREGADAGPKRKDQRGNHAGWCSHGLRSCCHIFRRSCPSLAPIPGGRENTMGSRTNTAPVGEAEPSARQRIGRFLLITLPTMLLLYGLIYYPHRADSVLGRGLTGYVRLIATVAGAILHAFDGAVTVSGHHIGGRFPLSIVLDCSALDAQALYVAAVLGIKARWSDKVVGVVGGLVMLTAVNLTRIVALYFVGVRAPHLFHVLHEEVLQLAVILCAFAAFGLWAYVALRHAQRTPGIA